MKQVIAVVVVAAGLLTTEGGFAGEPTRKLQKQLEAAGFQPGPIDGIYGPKTRAAVRAFQVAAELPASGWMDPATAARLHEACLVLTEAEERTSPPSEIVEADADDARVDEMFSAAEVEVRRVRLAAVEVLGELKTTRARAALGVVLYGNTIPAVRAAAAKKLGDFGDAPSVYTLALALESETDPEVRAVIAAQIERNLPVEPMDHAAALTGGWKGELVRIVPPPPPPSPWQVLEEPAPAVATAPAPSPAHACEGVHAKGVCVREEVSPSTLPGSWVVAALDADALDSRAGTLAPVEAVWDPSARKKKSDAPATAALAPAPAADSLRVLARGELVTTEDPLVVRGRARLGAYVVNVNGEPTRLDAQGNFVYRLRGEPRGEIELVVQEIDIQGRTTERVARLTLPPPTTVAFRR